MSCNSLVLFSGGQDSTTCLYWAMREFGAEKVMALSFDYQQRHRLELECAQHIANQAQVPHIVLPINTFAVLGGNALTAGIPVTTELNSLTGLPNTFVPGRNLIFLTFAAAFAYQHGINNLVTGVTQTDYSGYPDCRAATIAALELTLRLGIAANIKLHTPLMHLSKRAIILLAKELGALQALAWSHTCYNGKRPPCGECTACLIRAHGFAEAGIEDPLLNASIWNSAS